MQDSALRQFSRHSDLPYGVARICLRYIPMSQTLNPITRLAYCIPSLHRTPSRGRNINRLTIVIPSPKARLHLGTPNPPMIAIAEETLGFRRTRLSLVLRLLIPAFSLPTAPAHVTVNLRCDGNAPLPRSSPKRTASAISVLCLAPMNFRRTMPSSKTGSSSELLRTL